jgi:hypothetical protein
MGILKTSDLKPGMKGYGLTVFSGETPVKFDVEVISVMKRAMLDQDLILVRCSHPILEHSGVIAGMSGSPIYINGKFAGGLGYGYAFAKDPIAMLTPAEDIVNTTRRPVQNLDVWGRPATQSADAWTQRVRNAIVAANNPLARMQGESLIRPLGISLSVSGVPSAQFAQLFPLLSHLGPAAPSGAGTDDGVVRKYQPGGPVAIWLVSGDINVAAIGTVTYVEGDRVAVFSHPFLSMGEMRLPAGHATIHTVIARSSNSMKLGTFTSSRGSLIKDEQATVVLDQAAEPGFLPVTVSVVAPGEKVKIYNFKVARHRLLSANLSASLVRVAMNRLAQNATDLTYTVDHEFQMEGMAPIRFSDSFSSTQGLNLSFPGGWGNWGNTSRGEIALHLLLNNPFTRLAISRVNVKVHVTTGLNQYQIKNVEVASPVVQPDRAFTVQLTLKPQLGPEIRRQVTMKLPKEFAGNRVTLEVFAGRDAPIDAAEPRDLPGLLDYIQKSMDAHTLVLSVRTPAPQLDMEGVLVSDVPLSVLDSLVRRGVSTYSKVDQTLFRQTMRFPELLSGSAKCNLIVNSTVEKAE